MSFPGSFMEHLEGLPGFSLAAFEEAHRSIPPTSIRLNPYKPVSLSYDRSSVPWSRDGFYLSKRPSFTFDPLFHAGTYYVQEASSQLLEAFVLPMVQTGEPLRVLDLCAAPGGKSTHLLSLIRNNDLLVSNEVIRNRTGILSDNLDKWGHANVVVTQADPAVLGKLTGFFDLIVVDAPCSGSGLFRKDAEAMDHWSLSAVEHCAARQRRILKDIWPSLKEGGRLLYSTCSFSEAEDEEVVSWMQQEWDIVLNKIDLPAEWGVVETNYGYRCWPHLIKGEGFFIASVQKMSSESILSTRTKFSIKSQANAPTAFLGDWWERDQHELIDWKDMCWAIPSNRMADIQLIGSVCQPYRLGTCLGAWSRKDWIPDHALALSRYVQRTLPQLELDKDEAIRYLQRGAIDRAGLERGWLLATFQGRPMGWLKNIGNRMNNYYPSHLRILKQSVSPDQ